MSLYSTNDYLDDVRDWDDPYPRPLVEKYTKFWVVRDDILQFGSKIRFIDKLIRDTKTDGWVYGGATKVGYGPISLASACKKYNKKAFVFAATRKTPTAYQQIAIDLGAEFKWVDFGRLSNCEAKARIFAGDNPRYNLLPMGLEHPWVFGSIIKVIHDPNFLWEGMYNNIWVAAGSGTLGRGFQLAFPEKTVNMVQIGHKLSQREIGNGVLWTVPYAYDEPVKEDDKPPFPSNPYYDAKVWKVMQEYGQEGDLFWNVA